MSGCPVWCGVGPEGAGIYAGVGGVGAGRAAGAGVGRVEETTALPCAPPAVAGKYRLNSSLLIDPSMTMARASEVSRPWSARSRTPKLWPYKYVR